MTSPRWRSSVLAAVRALASFVIGVGTTRADVLSWDLERLVWSTQLGTTPIVGAYQLMTTATGSGLGPTTLSGPSGSLSVPGSSVQRSWSTNLTLGTTYTSATDLGAAFDQAYPSGMYRLQALIQTTNPITGRVTTRTNDLSANWTNGFSAVAPVVTNLAPPTPLTASQTFRWPGFGSGQDYASFYVFEGTFDTNLLIAIAEQGAAAITNLSVRHASPRLDPGPGAVTVTNLNPALDHLVWLEFHRLNPEANQALGEVSATRGNLMFFRGAGAPVIVSSPSSQTLPAGSRVILEVIASGGPLTYRWWRDGTLIDEAREAVWIIESLSSANAGTYEVEVSNASGTARSTPARLQIAETPVDTPASLEAWREDGQIRLRLSGSPSARYVVERSDDLPVWTEHAKVTTDASGKAEVRVNAVGRVRLFRASRASE